MDKLPHLSFGIALIMCNPRCFDRLCRLFSNVKQTNKHKPNNWQLLFFLFLFVLILWITDKFLTISCSKKWKSDLWRTSGGALISDTSASRKKWNIFSKENDMLTYIVFRYVIYIQDKDDMLWNSCCVVHCLYCYL